MLPYRIEQDIFDISSNISLSDENKNKTIVFCRG